MEDWLTLLRQKDKRTIAKVISKLENRDEQSRGLLKQLLPFTGKAQVIGITGPPGAGKSTLIAALLTFLRTKGLSIGVLAIDPTSPFSGGAILGDRIRMNRHALDEGIYLRSMANRGKVGGISIHTKDSMRVLDAAGFDVILIETVGVGQSELSIMNLADTICVVLHPGAGDMIQVTKAGVMEIADVYVVNKSDQAGASRLVAEIEDMLDLNGGKEAWMPSVIAISIQQNQGISDLWDCLQQHDQYLKQTGRWKKQRLTQLYQEIEEELLVLYEEKRKSIMETDIVKQQVAQLEKGETTPQELAEKLAKQLLSE